jgi:DNA polymerase beta
MAQYHRILRDQHRSKAYVGAISAVKAAPGPLLEASQLKGVSKIGKGTLARIDEIIRTGNLKEAEELRADPRMSELVSVHGFGPRAALKFAQLGVTTLAELRRRQDELDLNTAQRLGLKYHDSITQRIPYEEVVDHDHLLQHAIETFSRKALKLVVCGSYRRKHQTSGDVDALVTPSSVADALKVASSPGLQLSAFSDYLQSEVNYVVDRFGSGETKFMGMATLPGGVPRRLDLRFVSLAEFPTALLYFTGSKAFNVRMRSFALEKGFTLNEYGLYKIDGISAVAGSKRTRTAKAQTKGSAVNDAKKAPASAGSVSRIPVDSEEAIFEAIGMPFVNPEDRRD